MIPGLREAALMMQPGAKWELYIPPDLAYGRSSPLGHQAVIIELELLAVGAGHGGTTEPGPEDPGAAQKP
jgi:FKBP-type peptidyl-prolyl cis-trans isomerase